MTRWRRIVVAAWCVAGAVAASGAAGLCTQAAALETGALPPVPLAPDSVEARLESLVGAPGLAAAVKPAEAGTDDKAEARAYYGAHRYAPLWVDERGLNARAGQVLAEIGRAGDYGLTPADFPLPALKPGAAAASRDALADAELSVTGAVLKYARFARGGRISNPAAQLSEYIDRKPQLIAGATVLEQIAAAPAADTYLRGLHPQHPQFQRLRAAYVKALADRARLASQRLPEGPALTPGQSHSHVALLRKRLGVPAPVPAHAPPAAGVLPPVAGGGASGPAPAIADAAEVYDPALVAAVRAFQTQAGMRADGIVGDKTRAALNGGGDAQVAALLANMEQWRWMPADLGATHVMINIPEFQMRLVRNGAVIHTERVVTGKPDTATPVFSELMQTVVFQPKWGVPDSIKINELLPRLQDGRGLKSGLRMALGGREINPWSVDWSRADITRYQIYQPSGDDNALGVVKFLFPNKHAVYLHDTPAKTLFNAETRAYSHGCVRLRNPVRLAELVLGADKGWNADMVRELVEDGPEDNAIRLDSKIPVHITYFTAVADDAGHVQTFPDLYGHEARIVQALQSRGDRLARRDAPSVAPAGGAPARPVASSEPAAPARAAAPERRRRTAESYTPPAALGYAPKPGYPAPAPAFKAAPRFRGTTTNDIIMRALGGY